MSVAGATYQGLFRNPMVSPDILGASAGAGFGAAFGILMSFNPFGIQISAFLFGLAAVTLTYLISVIIARGTNVSKLRIIIILSSTLITASVVSIGGMIGWIGLIIPHIARIIVGPNFKRLLPASIFIGGTFLWDRYGAEEALQIQLAAKTLHPYKFQNIDIKQEAKNFYKTFFNYNLTDDEVNRILDGKSLD
ncbi:putative ABC transporter permease protein [Clostridium ljungdahlii]|uniref:Putative ABC transporter permease protein n=1 Tax=Clostridium ljungdahlii TaxID=1538 RepID=A0A168M260_9CLOT|nr:putative ABC transporter permease protein [Clostridium ljungdahlii]